MILLFGRKLCSACQDRKKELSESNTPYEYYDLDDSDGLAMAAYYGILGANRPLPIEIEILTNKNEG